MRKKEDIRNRAPDLKRKQPEGKIEKGRVENENELVAAAYCNNCGFNLLKIARKSESGKIETVWIKCTDCSLWNEIQKPSPDKSKGKYTRSVPTDWTFSDNPPN